MVRPITVIKGVKSGLECIEPMGIKFPEESFVLHNNLKTFTPIGSGGTHGGIVVKALCYKPAGRRFNS